MKKERIIWISIIAVLLIFIVYNFNFPLVRADENTEKNFIAFFEKVYYSLKNSYIDEKDPKDLLIGAIKGMIKTLDDPHTAFLEPQQKESLEIETKGEYGGLGIEIGVRDNKLLIISPMEDTPAERVGIKAGDIITKINNEPVSDPDLNEIIKKLRGKPNTEVTISVQREGIDELIDFTIIREIIQIKSIKSAKIDDIGYIRLATFSQNSPEELKTVLEEYVNKDKIKGIILDLRNNSGGLLDVAIRISDYFIKEGIIVYTKPRTNALQLNSALNKTFYATKENTLADDLPLVILVNKGTASASEILCGCVKDHKRGILVGTTTFGKGSVQSVITLSPEYAMRFTTAYYYTPNGIKIHKKGIVPDIEIDFPLASKDEIKDIKQINDEKLIKNFLEKNKTPGDNDIETFIKELRQKNIALNDRIIKMLVKQELYKYKRMPVYDLDYDVQLKMAVQILKSEIAGILQRK